MRTKMGSFGKTGAVTLIFCAGVLMRPDRGIFFPGGAWEVVFFFYVMGPGLEVIGVGMFPGFLARFPATTRSSFGRFRLAQLPQAYSAPKKTSGGTDDSNPRSALTSSALGRPAHGSCFSRKNSIPTILLVGAIHYLLLACVCHLPQFQRGPCTSIAFLTWALGQTDQQNDGGPPRILCKNRPPFRPKNPVSQPGSQKKTSDRGGVVKINVRPGCGAGWPGTWSGPPKTRRQVEAAMTGRDRAGLGDRKKKGGRPGDDSIRGGRRRAGGPAPSAVGVPCWWADDRQFRFFGR